MTTDQTPGGLLRQARMRSGLSARRASTLADVSESLWRHTELGYRAVAKGVRVPVNTGAERLRRMAEVVGADVAAILEAAGYDASNIDTSPRGEQGGVVPWQPPAAAHRMTPRQRRAVEGLIEVLTDSDDRQMQPKSSGSDGQPADAPSVIVDRLTADDDTPIRLAGAGTAPPLTETDNRYVVTVSDAIYERIKERLLSE